jgi:hypothetical protein
MKECVIVDGVRSANARAHKDKGWFRNIRPEQLLAKPKGKTRRGRSGFLRNSQSGGHAE